MRLPAILALAAGVACALDDAQCLASGFVRGLSCGVCRRVLEAAGEPAFKDCTQCCKSPFVKAELIASHEHVFLNKGLSEFMDLAKKQFKSTISFPTQLGSGWKSKGPKLVMIDAEGNKKDVPVAQWTSNQIEEYVREMLPAT